MTGIERAIERAGSVQAVADLLGLTNQSVSLMRAKGYVPHHHIPAIAEAYGIARRDLVDPRIREVLYPSSKEEEG